MDSLQEILFSLRQNKLRTGLTAFGVFWGILMLILLLGAGRGMEKAFAEGWSNDVADSIWIFPSTTSVPYMGLPVGRQIQLTQSDMAAIRQQIPGVRFLSSENPLGSFINSDISISYGTKSGSFGVLGVADQYFNIKEKIRFDEGRRLNGLDEDDNRKVVVIGTRVSERLFTTHIEAIGKEIQINGISFKVIGIFFDKGNQGRMSERIYMPVSAFKKAFGGGQDVALITVRPKEGVDGIKLEEDVMALLKQRHKIAPDDVRAIEASNMARAAQDVNAMFTGLNMFIWLVGIGTLLAGIVGVSNIMIITVKERTREIGIRKALGANPNSIVGSLLFESVLVTSVAGYSGLVLGVAILEGVSALFTKMKIELPFFQQPEIDIGVAISALVLLIASGVIAGLMPALRAARITPIEAMKAE
ncbi:ABC transporter permease [Cellvibrio sp. pealriver]|uniref:ABC transporter permease n=1 Tax=Cellvibrio sp. pealriver TaxID=1622269 RepID=UPI00066FD9CA|nr:ABC transporter permease [Cellvibrio sp. pealriver]